MTSRAPFEIGGADVKPGRSAQVELPVDRLITGAPMSMPVTVLHGANDGPTVWINAAVHGDELNGVEVVNRVLADLDPKLMNGTLLAVPVVNVHGFMSGDRYLPDRRDLNRSFPGSAKGSLASRMAHIFMTEIVDRCEIGIDLHTASDNRTNLPQIRADLDDPRTRELAEVFGVPLMMHSKAGAGTLRRAAGKTNTLLLLYEAGEALRFNKRAISNGVSGVRRVLRHLEIADWDGPERKTTEISRSSRWMRASKSGVLRMDVDLGDVVEERQVLGTIIDAFGKRLSTVKSTRAGLVIGRTLYPICNKGDALVHIASLEESNGARETSGP